VKPERVLADLRALEELTGGRRLAWTEEWMRAREDVAAGVRALDRLLDLAIESRA
jgi:hypothetical protein